MPVVASAQAARRCAPSTLAANSLTTPTFSLSARCALATRGGIRRSLRLLRRAWFGPAAGVETDRWSSYVCKAGSGGRGAAGSNGEPTTLGSGLSYSWGVSSGIELTDDDVRWPLRGTTELLEARDAGRIDPSCARMSAEDEAERDWPPAPSWNCGRRGCCEAADGRGADCEWTGCGREAVDVGIGGGGMSALGTPSGGWTTALGRILGDVGLVDDVDAVEPDPRRVGRWKPETE